MHQDADSFRSWVTQALTEVKTSGQAQFQELLWSLEAVERHMKRISDRSKSDISDLEAQIESVSKKTQLVLLEEM